MQWRDGGRRHPAASQGGDREYRQHFREIMIVKGREEKARETVLPTEGKAHDVEKHRTGLRLKNSQG